MNPNRFAIPLALLLTGCAGVPAGGSPAAGDDAPSAAALEAAGIAVTAAQERLAAAESDAAIQEEMNRLSLETARSELKQAQMRLALLENVDGKKRTDEAALAVRQAQDMIDDATDELDQLKKMYGENELADATKEIVIKRGERQLVRAREGLAIQQVNQAKVRDEIATEREKASLELLQKQRESEQAALKARNLSQQKRAAVLEAQASLKKAQDEQDQLKKKAKPADAPKPESGK